MSRLLGKLVLNEDVLLIPVLDLPDESRSQFECNDDDVAVSRMGGRSGSKIVDADAAALLNRFREPRSAVEAVILFARERSLEPDSVLESAYPMLRSMAEGGVLIPAEEPGQESQAPGAVAAGSAVLGGVVLRTLQVLEDTEVCLLAHASAPRSVLKIQRIRPSTGGHVLGRLNREATVLAYLNGDVAPKLYGHGDLGGRRYLELELVAGIDAVAAAAEWRDRSTEAARGSLLDLLRSVTAAYARPHERRVLHGDVHPRNVLIDASGHAHLIDFGLARAIAAHNGLPTEVERGGIPFFFEPEYAATLLVEAPSPFVTEASEQYAVAALLYLLV